MRKSLRPQCGVGGPEPLGRHMNAKGSSNVKMLSGSFADAETVIEALEYVVKPEIILAVVLGHGAILDHCREQRPAYGLRPAG